MKYLLLGNTGKLGKAFDEYFNNNHFTYISLGRKDFDALKPDSLEKTIVSFEPDVVINCVCMNGKIACEENFELATALNANFPKWLAKKSNVHQFKLLHFSTESVFSSNNLAYFTESDSPLPSCSYGKTKLAGELQVSLLSQNYSIVRLNILFGSPLGSGQMIEKLIDKIVLRHPIWIDENFINSPTYIHDIPEAVIANILPMPVGCYHLRNEGVMSLKEFLEKIAKILQKPIILTNEAPVCLQNNLKIQNKTILNSVKIKPLRNVDLAIEDFLLRLDHNIKRKNDV